MTAVIEDLRDNLDFLQAHGYKTHIAYCKTTGKPSLTVFYKNPTDELRTMKLDDKMPGVILLGTFIANLNGILKKALDKNSRIQISGMVKEISTASLYFCRDMEVPGESMHLAKQHLDELDWELSRSRRKSDYNDVFVLSLNDAKAYLPEWADANNLEFREELK